MSRISRNQAYHIHASQRLPIAFVIRDILLTGLAWSLILYLGWDFLVELSSGIMREFDENPMNDLDWIEFSHQLRLSFLFTGSVVIFIMAWALHNLRLLRRSQHLEGRRTKPLRIDEEAKVYGCSAEEVRAWRKMKIVTVSVDDTGKIMKVDCNEQQVDQQPSNDL